MRISVLIAVPGECGLLPQALASVQGQTHRDWDVAIVAAGRDVAGIVTRHDELSRRARVANVPAGMRTATLRNRLLALATGEAAAFLEPNDAWEPNHLQEADGVLRAGADIAVSDLHCADRDGRTAPAGDIEANPIRVLFARNAIPTPSCAVFRRACAERAGEFDARYVVAEPRDFWLRCALAGARLHRTGVDTCRRGPEATGAVVLAADATLFYEKFHDLAAVPAAMRRRLLVSSLIMQGRLLRTSDPPGAARCFARAWSLQPMHVQTLGQFALTRWTAEHAPRREPP